MLMHAIIVIPYHKPGGPPSLKYMSPKLKRQFDLDLSREPKEMRDLINRLIAWQETHSPEDAIPEDLAAVHATIDARLENIPF